MIPDGMSVDGLALARWYKSYDAETGVFDTSVSLTLDGLVSGLVRTWWQAGDKIGAIVDSAPATTAMASGIKTNDKFIGVTCESVPVSTILEAANLKGKSTGIIATSNIQHATPAGFSAHYNDRSRFPIIAEQQVHNNIDVVFGGGSQFLTNNGRDNIKALKDMGYQYITTKEDMDRLTETKVWGMFAPNAMAYDFDRAAMHPEQPSLAEMTAKAIELLSLNEEGFFLMVEGSKIDWTAHANDPIGLISDILAFDAAVSIALDFAKESQDTMLLIMSDHGTGGITIGNRDTQDSRAVLPYDSAAIDNFIIPLTQAKLTGEGIETKLNEDRTNIKDVMSEWYGIDDLTDEEEARIKETAAGSMNHTVGLMISKRAYLGWTSHGHTGQEVNLFTYLPGDGRITGTLDNTDIAKICAGVWGINLEAVTKQLFNEAETIFRAKGAAVTINEETGDMTVTKGNTTIVIPEYRNYVILNGERVMLDSVIVNQSGKYYVPQTVIDMIP
jgi:alkaline phosphatase